MVRIGIVGIGFMVMIPILYQASDLQKTRFSTENRLSAAFRLQ